MPTTKSTHAEAFDTFMTLVWSGGELYDTFHNAITTGTELFRATLETSDEKSFLRFPDGSLLVAEADGSGITL